MARVALVTGGGRGIGRECVLALARKACAVAAAARTRSEVDRVAKEASALGVRTLAVEVDVTDAAQVERAVREVMDALGPVDVLVNNAGIADSAPFTRTDRELWERHLRVNVTGPYLLTQAVLPGMLARRWGRVINIASLAGLYGAAYVTAYVASKHALVGFTRALALEVSGKGITVNAICPGYVATDLTWKSARNIAARTGTSFDEAVAALARINPGGRLIDPGEVAIVVARLLEDEATNGQTLVIDGSGPIPEPEEATEP
ncbi:MAG: SDR family NAD(P)-dependent oxidoreductase [Candidatus Rokubacteria bacterium]|nr:SDR family NAD(P)-dependent oxidoreductase [Candidatus Rokubacteria bacterium]